MLIHEAITAADDTKQFITRKTWELDGTEKHVAKILPTNTPDGCIITSDFSKMRPARGWQPRMEDLLADDWYPCYGTLRFKED